MKKTLLLLLTVFIPAICFGQVSDDDYEKAVEFLEGGNILEDWFMKIFLGGYREILMKDWNSFVDIAVAIGGGFAILYFSIKAYELMTGDKEFQILPLLRPFALCMVILNWGGFIALIDAPMQLMWEASAQKYEKTIPENRALRISRARYQKLLVETLFSEAADNEIAAETAKKSFLDDPLGVTKDAAIDVVLKPIFEFKQRLNIAIQQILSQLLEILALWILRIMVYLVFALQIIYSAILVFLGPISVAFSILPMFKDAFKTWIARYISVQFYLVVAFLILYVCSCLQTIAMTAEIDRYKELITSDGTVVSIEKIMWLQANGILSFGFVIVAFLVSAIAILSVPKVSTWIIATAGTAGVMGGMGKVGQAAATKGGSLLK